MAQLTWRPVEAPNISLRDTMLAGQNIGSSFDRMAQMLKDRETNLTKQATDQQAAAVLMAQDEAGLNAAAQAALATGNRRVDNRAIAELVNSQRNVMLERTGMQQDNTLRNEQILDKQGSNAIAPLDMEIRELMFNGKFDEANSMLQAIAQEDPVAARGIRQSASEWWDSRTGGITERREQKQDDRTYQLDQQRVGLEGQRVALTRQQQQFDRDRLNQQDQGMATATTFAEDYRLMDTATAKAKLFENPNFVQMMQTQPVLAKSTLAAFDAAHGALTSETADVAAGFRPLDSQIATQNTALETAANRAENMTRTPAIQGARRALANDGKVAANDVIAAMAESGPYFNASTAATDYNYVMENVPGARPEDVQAAIEQFGMSSGWWTRNVLPTNMDDVLKSNVEKIVAARNQGYTQNADLDVAMARSQFESKAAEIANLRAEMARYARAQAAGTQLTPKQAQQQKAQMDRLEALLSQ